MYTWIECIIEIKKKMYTCEKKYLTFVEKIET